MAFPTFSTFHAGRIREVRPAAAEQHFIRIEVPEHVLAAHQRAGQFLKLRSGDTEGIFALWRAPFETQRAGTLDLLVRTVAQGADAGSVVARLQPGAEVHVTEPTGEGVPLERAAGRPIHFVAAGTALAPVRAAIEQAIHESLAGIVSLDVGLRSADHRVFADELGQYAARGIRVHEHFSAPDAEGRIHGMLAHEALLERLSNFDALVVCIGHPAMTKALRALFVDRGGRAEDIVGNF